MHYSSHGCFYLTHSVYCVGPGGGAYSNINKQNEKHKETLSSVITRLWGDYLITDRRPQRILRHDIK